MSDEDLRNSLLEELSTLFSKSGCNIRDFNLPRITASFQCPATNRLIEEESSYPSDGPDNLHSMLSSLNDGQLQAFHTIVNCVLHSAPGFFFVSGYGGTGKTYLWKCIVAHLRSQQKIVLAVASSGVASLLLPGGRTAHSRFKIPCDLDEPTICEIKRGTMLAELIQATSLIIWDEALMTSRRAFEAVDRSLRDIQAVCNPTASSLPFGGKVVVLGGDLRQILPVIEGGSRADIINAAIVNSPLRAFVKVLHLTENMRLSLFATDIERQQEIAAFSNWLLDVGEGKIESRAKEGDTEPGWIKIPSDLLLYTKGDKLISIVDAVYPNLLERYLDEPYLQERAILAPTNEIVDIVNNHVVALLPGPPTEYLSCDSISRSAIGHETYELLYPVEFLNSINGNNFPQHVLSLKIGVPIMLLRNLNQTDGLCNGTRLIVTQLGDKIIQAKLITGPVQATLFLYLKFL